MLTRNSGHNMRMVVLVDGSLSGTIMQYDGLLQQMMGRHVLPGRPWMVVRCHTLQEMDVTGILVHVDSLNQVCVTVQAANVNVKPLDRGTMMLKYNILKLKSKPHLFQ